MGDPHRHQTLCDALDNLFGDDWDGGDFDDGQGSFGRFWDGMEQGAGVVRVARLRQEHGEQSWTWDGTDSRGMVVANGTYRYTIIARAGWHFSNPKCGTVAVERRDTRPPVAADERPRDNSTVWDRSPLICVDLTDDLSGVDPASIELWVDNVQVTPTIVQIPGGYRVAWQPENAFESDAVITVRVEAGDLEGNSMAHSWSFTIEGGRGRSGSEPVEDQPSCHEGQDSGQDDNQGEPKVPLRQGGQPHGQDQGNQGNQNNGGCLGFTLSPQSATVTDSAELPSDHHLANIDRGRPK